MAMKKYIIAFMMTVGMMNISTATCNDAIDSKESDSVVICYNSATQKMIVSNADENVKIEVSNMLGVKMFSGRMTKPHKDTFDVKLTKGFYVVRIGCCDVKRIVVR